MIKSLALSVAFLVSFLFTSLANAGGMSFTCNGYKFSVYEDKTPLEYSMMAGDKIVRDTWNGKVTNIGNISIKYDEWTGQVTSIGKVAIKYHTLNGKITGKIEEIGGMRIEYDSWTGLMTGTSGSINCNG